MKNGYDCIVAIGLLQDSKGQNFVARLYDNATDKKILSSRFRDSAASLLVVRKIQPFFNDVMPNWTITQSQVVTTATKEMFWAPQFSIFYDDGA